MIQRGPHGNGPKEASGLGLCMTYVLSVIVLAIFSIGTVFFFGA